MLFCPINPEILNTATISCSTVGSWLSIFSVQIFTTHDTTYHKFWVLFGYWLQFCTAVDQELQKAVSILQVMLQSVETLHMTATKLLVHSSYYFIKVTVLQCMMFQFILRIGSASVLVVQSSNPLKYLTVYGGCRMQAQLQLQILGLMIEFWVPCNAALQHWMPLPDYTGDHGHPKPLIDNYVLHCHLLSYPYAAPHCLLLSYPWVTPLLQRLKRCSGW